MKDLFPVFVNLSGKTVLLVGGGEVARQKLAALAPTGAHVVLVDPRAGEQVLSWGGEGSLSLARGVYSPELLAGVSLVFAATDDPAVNHRVAADAEARGIWANVVDDPAHCRFHTPSILRRGAFTVAVSSGGGFPGFTRALRRVLERLLPVEDDGALARLFSLRERLIASGAPAEERSRALKLLAQWFEWTYLKPGVEPQRQDGGWPEDFPDQSAAPWVKEYPPRWLN
ncbi:MAG: bifunctional precorrin-2 dehydrogenase/sirohydrochlorin ferrochelatase [Deltaproteobacteria bacterium]|nr:bifunctional precorrin-2 dehydrogenase/sirohydrochlorin ferrochelatase [Deltaproteobacteria bacterium]